MQTLRTLSARFWARSRSGSRLFSCKKAATRAASMRRWSKSLNIEPHCELCLAGVRLAELVKVLGVGQRICAHLRWHKQRRCEYCKTHSHCRLPRASSGDTAPYHTVGRSAALRRSLRPTGSSSAHRSSASWSLPFANSTNSPSLGLLSVSDRQLKSRSICWIELVKSC